MGRVGQLSLLVTLAAMSASAAHAQSTVAPTAPATASQVNSIYSSVARPSAASPVPADQPNSPGVGYAYNGVVWTPSVTGGAFYDDNVFATHNNRQGDWAGVARPELAWRTDKWANVEAAGAAFVEQRWYDRFKSEDQLNGGAVVGSTITPGENTQLVNRLAYIHSHEDRGTSDSINTAFTRPLRYDELDASGAVNQRYGRFWTSFGAAASLVNFGNGTVAGTTVSQGYRDGTIGSLPIRAGYVVAPLTSVFVEVAPNVRDFHVNAFDSNGYRVVGGALFEPGPGSRIKGEIFGGYMNQNYTGVGFRTVSTFTYGSSLAFILRPDLTAVLEGRRDAREISLSGGVFAGVPGDGVSVIESTVAGRLDWSVQSNLVLGAGLAYLRDDYLGAGRVDEAVSPLASIKYFATKNLTLGFDYRYLTFDSSGFGVGSYYKNVYLLTANWKI